MKSLAVTALLATNILAYELIHVSNSSNPDDLKELSKKYKQDLIVNEGSVYVAPSSCIVERYYGGLAQNHQYIEKEMQHLQGYEMTQALFEAEDKSRIDEEIYKRKKSDEIEGRVAKAFLDDNEGRLFGGHSQTPVDLSSQREIAVRKSTKEKPTCRVLKGGLGYAVEGGGSIKIYKDNKLSDLKDNTLYFK